MPANNLKFKYNVRFTCVVFRNAQIGDYYRVRRRFVIWAESGGQAVEEARKRVRRRPRLRTAHEPRYSVISVSERGNARRYRTD